MGEGALLVSRRTVLDALAMVAIERRPVVAAVVTWTESTLIFRISKARTVDRAKLDQNCARY